MEKQGVNYYVHAIHTKDNANSYYIRVTPDLQETVYSQKIQVGGNLVGQEAVFVSQSGIIGQVNAIGGFQAYIVGKLRDYTTKEPTFVDFNQDSYALWTAFDDLNSCTTRSYENIAIDVISVSPC